MKGPADPTAYRSGDRSNGNHDGRGVFALLDGIQALVEHPIGLVVQVLEILDGTLQDALQVIPEGQTAPPPLP